MRPNPPNTRLRSGARAARSAGFTLIELLAVIAIIGILVSITVGLMRGIHQRSQVAKAKAELASLAGALERYKLQYGDYPWVPEAEDPPGVGLDGGAILFNALSGNLGPQGVELTEKGRSFVELSRFTLTSNDDYDLPDPENSDVVENWFQDPWGKWYYYAYKKSANDPLWESPSYLLYSHGPDMECDIGEAKNTGLISDVPKDATHAVTGERINDDNLFAGRDT